jgi:hypothetical protein
MSNEVFVLTVLLPKRTRIQFGCASDILTETLERAVATGVFHSFRMVMQDKLPKRSASEISRAVNFIGNN